LAQGELVRLVSARQGVGAGRFGCDQTLLRVSQTAD